MEVDNLAKKENNDKSGDKPRNSDFRIAFISGSYAMLGILVGSLITGYFSIKSQIIIAQQLQVCHLQMQIP